jgi:hypothetical protein
VNRPGVRVVEPDKPVAADWCEADVNALIVSRVWKFCWMLALLVAIGLPFGLVSAAQAAVPSTPLHWAKTSFADEGQAVETLTIRAAKGSQDTFIRFVIANAGFQKGQLTVTFRQESPTGTMYGKETYERGKYTVAKDKIGITAGPNVLKHEGGKLVLHLELDGLVADCTLSSSASAMSVKDNGNGYIHRNLLVPVGKLKVTATKADLKFDGTGTGFAMHEASTAPAHKTYERSVRLHNVAGHYLLIDYAVLPKDRGSKVLGFVVIAGKGKTFVGEVTKEERTEEKKDGSSGYEVPYNVQVLAKRGDHKAAIALKASKQTKRADDLANLPWAARKAVGAVFHPITFTLKGEARAEVMAAGATEAVVIEDKSVQYTYSQAN